jgi:hypothetical protein
MTPNSKFLVRFLFYNQKKATNIDSRGKKLSKSQKRGEDLKKFYEVQKEEEEKENQEEGQEEEAQDDAESVEEGTVESDTTSGSDISDDEEIIMEAEDQESKEKIEVGDPSTRLAIVNCDWDKLKVIP